jgi:hypothetical protein
MRSVRMCPSQGSVKTRIEDEVSIWPDPGDEMEENPEGSAAEEQGGLFRSGSRGPSEGTVPALSRGTQRGCKDVVQVGRWSGLIDRAAEARRQRFVLAALLTIFDRFPADPLPRSALRRVYLLGRRPNRPRRHGIVAGRLTHREESHPPEGGCDHEGRQASRIGRDRNGRASMRPSPPGHAPCRAGQRRDRFVVTRDQIRRSAFRTASRRWPGPPSEGGAPPARVCRQVSPKPGQLLRQLDEDLSEQ